MDDLLYSLEYFGILSQHSETHYEKKVSGTVVVRDEKMMTPLNELASKDKDTLKQNN